MNSIQKDENRYRKKYKSIKLTIKNILIENAALCDEVCKLQSSIQIVKEERKFLLRKLLEYENEAEIGSQPYYISEPTIVSLNGPPNAKVKKRRSLEDGGKVAPVSNI